MALAREGSAQDSRAYAFTTDTLASIHKDRNGNQIDFSGSNSVFQAYSANQNTAIQSLPFDVVFLGKVYRNYLIGTSGYIALGNTGVPTEPFLFPNSAGNSFQLGTSNNYINQGVIAPFWDFQTVKEVRTTLSGTAPNRCFVVEWVSYLPGNGNTTPGSESRYQARIYEASGAIEYVYASMRVTAGSANAVTATIGISRSSALGNFSYKALSGLDTFRTVDQSDEYTSEIDALYNSSDTGFIPGLHSMNDTSCRRFLFLPAAMSAPGNLRVFNIRQDSALIYWDDNSTDELKFQLFKVDRNGNFLPEQEFNKNVNYLQLTGLKPSETYTFKVRGYNEGDFSNFSNTLSFTTLPPRLVEVKNSGLWSDTGTWGGFIPSHFDSVVISNNLTVTLDVANAKCYNLVADNGTLVFQDSTFQNSLEIGDDLRINPNGAVRVAQSPKYTNFNNHLLIRGNLINDGILKLYDTGNVVNEVGAILNFYNIGFSEFYGNPQVNDLYELVVQRSGLNDSVLVHPSKLSVRGSNEDLYSGAGFLRASSMVGVIAFSGNFKLETRLFNAGGPEIPSLGAIVIDNDSLEVVGLPEDYSIEGGLTLRKGVFNAGLTDQNSLSGSFDIRIEGGELNVSGPLFSTNATSFRQSGGIVRVATQGNTGTQPSFGLTSPSTIVELSGGTLIISQPGTDASGMDYLVSGNPDYSDFKGGRLRLRDDGVLTGGRAFRIGGNAPMLQVDSARNAGGEVKVTLAEALHVFGRLELSEEDRINLNDESLHLYGDSLFVEGWIEDLNGDGTLVFKGDTQSVYGNGKIRVPGIEILLTGDLSVFDLPNDSLVHSMRLGLTRGQVKHAKWLNLGDSLETVTIQVGSYAGNYNGAILDSFPAFDYADAPVILTYTNLQAPWTSGYEIPANRKVNRFIVDTDNEITLAGGLLTVGEYLGLLNGVVLTDTTNILYLQAGENTDLYAAGGAYVSGPLSRKVAAGQNGSKNFLFPVGGEAAMPLNLENLQTANTDLVLTVEHKSDTLRYDEGYKITQTDSSFGYWYIKADSQANSLDAFNLTIDYKTTDGFVRLAGGVAPDRSQSSPVVLDSIGTRLSNTSVKLRATGLSLDSINPVMYIIPAEYLGDTLYAADYKIGDGWDFRNLTELSKKLNASYIADDLTFSITDEYKTSTEEFPIFFDQMRYADGPRKITVQLDSGVFGVETTNDTKTLDPDYGMIALFGADSIEFDGTGRDILGVPTDTREWTFRTGTNGSYAAVFRFANDARHVTLKGLNIEGNSLNTSMGAVLISGTHEGWKGNDYLNFLNCYFAPAPGEYAFNGLINNGANAFNDSIRVEGCEFADFYNYYIYTLNNTGMGWKISHNHFYRINTSLNGASSMPLYLADTEASAYEISYNYFGGSEKFAGGNYWEYTGSGTISFAEFRASLDVPSVFKGNVFRNYYQSTTGSVYLTLFNFSYGHWSVNGNTFGSSSSFNDGININNYRISSVVYTPNNNYTRLHIADNEFSYIRHNSSNTTTTRGLRMIEYNANLDAVIERNKMHHFEIYSRRTGSLQDGAFVAIRIYNTADSNIIRENEVHNLVNNYNNVSYITAIGIEEGGGWIEGNKVFDFSYTSTSTSVGYLVGFHINGSRYWMIRNNMVVLDNTDYPNASVSMQGIRYYSTSSRAADILHNTVLLRGQTRNTNSYAVVCGNYAYNMVLMNNLIINDNEMTGGSTRRSFAFHGQTLLTGIVSDYNHYYARVPENLIYDQNFSIERSMENWQQQSGMDLHSTSGVLPEFFSSKDLRLTSDTVNWVFKAVGASMPAVPTDIEGDARHQGQPDLGADEFMAPLYDEPVYVSGSDTLCAGNTRTLTVSNPNTFGEVAWFGSINSFDTLHIGTTLVTGVIEHDTVFYATVFDTLKRSHRLAIPVKVVPVLSAQVINAPADSLCAGTQVELAADSAQYNTTEWFSTFDGLSPVHTGRSLLAGPLNSDTVFYLENIYDNGIRTCRSVRDSVVVLVSQAPVSGQTLSDQTVCANEQAQWQINGPDELRVYAGSFADQPIAADTFFQTPALNTSTTYYYEVFNGSCAGERKPVQVNVNPIPALPQIDSVIQACFDEDITLNPLSSGTVNWFVDDSLSTSFATGGITLSQIQSDTVLYCSNTVNGCESGRKRVSIRVKQAGVPVLLAAQTPVCSGSQSTLLAALSGNGQVEWYADANLNNLLGTGNNYTTANLTALTRIYFVGRDQLCFSETDSIDIQVSAVPTVPVITPATTVCQGTRDTLQASSNGTLQWMSSENGPVIATGASYITPVLNGNTKYYVRTELAGCISNATSVSIPVIARPEPALVISVPDACRNGSVDIEVAGNHNVEWFQNAGTTTPLASGNVFTTPALSVATTFYYETFDGQCRSQRAPVTVAVRSTPANPVLSATQPFCWGEEITAFATSANNSVVRWYATDTSSQPFLVDDRIYLGNRYTDTFFYVESFDGVCAGNRVQYRIDVIEYLRGFDLSIPDSVILGDSGVLSLSGENNNLYGWNFGNNASISSATGEGPHKISWSKTGIKKINVFVTRTQGQVTCDTVITKELVVYEPGDPNGIADVKGMDLKVYPNPAKEVLNVELELRRAQACTLMLYDATGKLCLNGTLGEVSTTHKKQIELNGLNPGVYMLVICAADDCTTYKVIIEQ